MASKLTQRQQRNNQILEKPKLLPHPKETKGTDPWTFLEAVDAPQWVDLSLEPRSIGKDNADSWFGETHEHHILSLAGLKKSLSWLSPGKFPLGKKSNQSVSFKRKDKRYHMLATKPEKKQSLGHLKVSDYSHSTKVKDVRSRKKASYSNSAYRTSSAHLSSCALHGLVDTPSTCYDSSNTCEPGKSVRECNLGMGLQKRSSQGFSIKSKSLINVRRGSSKQVEGPHGTPRHSASGGQRGRSSFSPSSSSYPPKSNCSSKSGSSALKSYELEVSTLGHSLMNWRRGSSKQVEGPDSIPMRSASTQRGRSSSSASSSAYLSKSGYSSKSGGSTCTTLRSHELRVSTLEHSPDFAVSHLACHEDQQFSDGSAASCVSQEPVIEGCAKNQEGESPNLWEVGDIINCKQPSEAADVGFSGFEQSAKETVKRGLKVGTQRFVQTRASKIWLPPKKQLCPGKENAPPNKNATENSVQVKDKFCPLKTRLTFASSERAKAKCDFNKGNSGEAVCAPQISQRAGCVQAATREGVVAHPVKAGSCAQQRKRVGVKQDRVCTSYETKEERDLAALVAQHNQKVRTLRLHGYGKGLR